MPGIMVNMEAMPSDNPLQATFSLWALIIPYGGPHRIYAAMEVPTIVLLLLREAERVLPTLALLVEEELISVVSAVLAAAAAAAAATIRTMGLTVALAVVEEVGPTPTGIVLHRDTTAVSAVLAWR